MQAFQESIQYLQTKKRILFLTTSNRWSGEKDGEIPKSTRLAYSMQRILGKKVRVLEIPKLLIHPCEGNVSTANGNTCGVLSAQLKDKEKNPTGDLRCWASMNNADDELWKVTKELLQSDAVVFFGSVRWGQMNSIYQKLIERLTWIENRHSTLGEENILKSIDAGIIVTGHNWQGAEVVTLQKEVLSYFGFRVAESICWNWQYTDDASEESPELYLEAVDAFDEEFPVSGNE